MISVLIKTKQNKNFLLAHVDFVAMNRLLPGILIMLGWKMSIDLELHEHCNLLLSCELKLVTKYFIKYVTF